MPVAALLGDEAKAPVGRPPFAGQGKEAKACGGVEALDQRHVHEQLHAGSNLVHVLSARSRRPHLPHLERARWNRDTRGDRDRIGHGALS